MRSPALRFAIAALAPAAALVWMACGSSYAEGPPADTADAEDEPYVPRPRDAAPKDSGDAGLDAAPKPCDPSTPFINVTALTGSLNSAQDDAFPTLTDDELTIYFQRSPVGGGNPSFFFAERKTVNDVFGPPTELVELGDGRYNSAPSVTSGGDALFFGSDSDIRTSLRGSSGRFGAATSVPGLATSDFENSPALFARGEELWFSLTTDGGIHLRRAVRFGDGGFTAPQAIPELEGTGYEVGIASSRDGLTVYFGSPRAGGLGNADVWVARRTSRSGAFTRIEAETEVNTRDDDQPGWLSPDNCRLYLTSARLGTYDLFVATRLRPP